MLYAINMSENWSVILRILVVKVNVLIMFEYMCGDFEMRAINLSLGLFVINFLTAMYYVCMRCLSKLGLNVKLNDIHRIDTFETITAN